VGNQMITVPARILPPPRLQYKSKDSRPKMIDPSSGAWNMAQVKFQVGGNMGDWTYLNVSRRERQAFGPTGPDDTVKAFAAALSGYGIGNRFDGSSARSVEVTREPATYTAVERTLTEQARNGRKLRFILVIIPNRDVEMYKRIKKLADQTLGVNVVCVVADKFAKGQPQYFANVALKFNLKSGGINQIVEPAKLGIIAEGKTMVVGIDVTHPQPGSASQAPSVAGIVASIDPHLGQWPAELGVQDKSRQEMVSGIGNMFKNRLLLWRKHNKILPENVLIYRDGVSEGQYETVLADELPKIRAACEELYPAPDLKKGLPRLSIVIVGKRHHTRFYPTRIGDADSNSNCPNGTVVDRGVTEVRNWDFFLQAHTSLQGTARPAHYYVVLDEIFSKRPVKPPHKNAADSLEDLTHNMCHLFGRATKAVSICPAAYYADLVCERARCYLAHLYEPSDSGSQTGEGTIISNVNAHPNLRDTMFYI
jgi:eukaryotic translation initiation factor 2C